MTLRLLKYELRAVYKPYILVLSVFLAVNIIFACIIGLVINVLGDFGIAIGATASLLWRLLYMETGSVIVSVVSVFSIVRYVRTIWGKESYIYQSLPATAHEHILSHFLSFIIWLVAVLGVICAGAFISDLMTEGFFFGIHDSFVGFVWDENELIPTLLSALTLIPYLIIHAFFSIAFGQSFYKGKWVITAVFYIVTHIAAACIAILFGTSFLNKWDVFAHDLFLCVYAAILAVCYYFFTIKFVDSTRETY